MNGIYEEDSADVIFILSNFTLTTKQDNDVVKPLRELQDFQPQQKCPNCGSNRSSLIKLPKGAAHYAVCTCGECDRFLGWQAKPENQEKQRQQQAQIITLLESSQLNQWEWKFLMGLQGKRSLSPKQQKVLTQIEMKWGGRS
jgi:hypothetical protein